MKNLPQKLVLIIAAIMLFVIFGSQLREADDVAAPTPEPAAVEMEDVVVEQEPEVVKTVSYQATTDGDNAFELLQENADVEFEQYDFGVFVKSINGVSGDNEYFWSLYVNGEQSVTGADQTFLEEGDLVEWRYEEVK